MECQHQENGRWFLDGVVSYGYYTQTNVKMFTMFTNTEMFSNWVENAVELLEKSSKNYNSFDNEQQSIKLIKIYS